MTKKWKILGYQTNVEWFDVKTKFKKLLRGILYSRIGYEIICSLVVLYMKFVYLTSKKTFVNHAKFLDVVEKKESIILAFWHNRLMMTPFVTVLPRKRKIGCGFMTLASKHGDGRFVGGVMEKFKLTSILGSTQDGRKSSRGISFSSLKQIIEGLKKRVILGITPDGPRGPNQKINGDIIGIAKLTGAKIMPISYSCSKFKQINSWDKFKIPLPFSKLCFYFDEALISVARDVKEQEISRLEADLENRINFIQQACDNKVSSRHC